MGEAQIMRWQEKNCGYGIDSFGTALALSCPKIKDKKNYLAHKW